jgi:hypothetical protein
MSGGGAQPTGLPARRVAGVSPGAPRSCYRCEELIVVAFFSGGRSVAVDVDPLLVGGDLVLYFTVDGVGALVDGVQKVVAAAELDPADRPRHRWTRHRCAPRGRS